MTANLVDADVRAVFTEHLPVLQSAAIKLRERLRQWHKKGHEVLKAADQEPDYDEFKCIYNHWIKDLQHVSECSSELASLVAKLGEELPPLAEALKGFAEAT
jgi:hypothetical protein